MNHYGSEDSITKKGIAVSQPRAPCATTLDSIGIHVPVKRNVSFIEEGHSSGVRSVAISIDGRFVFTHDMEKKLPDPSVIVKLNFISLSGVVFELLKIILKIASKLKLAFSKPLAVLLLLLLTGCASSDLALMGPGFPIPLPGTHTFKIDSEPKGADVYFNGKLKGKTPVEWNRTLLFQTIQRYKIECKVPGHQNGFVLGWSHGNHVTSANANVRSWPVDVDVTFKLPLLSEGENETPSPQIIRQVQVQNNSKRPLSTKCAICGRPAIGYCTMRHKYVCETHRYFTNAHGQRWHCP